MFGLIIGFILLALIVWLVFKLDCDLQLKWSEKFGQPISTLKGKVVWITGASSGIGEGLAYILAANGCKLVISGTNETRLQEVKRQCILSGPLDDKDVLVLAFDIKDYSVHEKQLQLVIKHFQKLDILVSNAGRSQRASFEDIDIDVDKEMFEINVFGLINMTRIVLRYFLQNNLNGQFVVTSSTAGKLGVPNSGSYTASKHALHGYYECLRVELGSKGISITMLCPGPVFSRILENAMSDKLDKTHGLVSHGKDNKRLATSRCAQLMAIAIANQLDECWIALQPVLTLYYFSQYLPTISRKLMAIFLNPQRMARLREGSK